MCSSHGVQGQKSSTQRLGNVFCCWCDRKQRIPLQADLGTVLFHGNFRRMVALAVIMLIFFLTGVVVAAIV